MTPTDTTDTTDTTDQGDTMTDGRTDSIVDNRTSTTCLGLWLLAAQPLLLVAELAGAVVVWVTGSAPYDLARNTISDLGAVGCTSVPYPQGPIAVCSPAHVLVDGSFVVGGLALAAGAVLARGVLPRGPLRAWAVAMWVVTGVSSAATGLVPLDVDLDLHTLVSLPLFLSQPAALCLTSLAIRRAHPRLAATGLAIAAVALAAGSAVSFVLDALALGGLWERLALWPVTLWLGVAAGCGLRRRTPIRPESTVASARRGG